MSFLGGGQKELLGTLSKSGRQGRILLDRSVGDHSVPAAPAVAPTILQMQRAGIRGSSDPTRFPDFSFVLLSCFA